MAKASLTLPSGTVVQIEGTAAEVRDLLGFYSGGSSSSRVAGAGPSPSHTPRKQRRSRISSKKEAQQENTATRARDLSEIVNLTKTCDEAEKIEQHILDRSSQVDRTLLPLYIVHEHLGNEFGLSFGEVSKITTDLGVPVSQPNASGTLSGTAAKYVIGDRVRCTRQNVRHPTRRYRRPEGQISEADQRTTRSFWNPEMTGVNAISTDIVSQPDGSRRDRLSLLVV
jgi:hypothetical protein